MNAMPKIDDHEESRAARVILAPEDGHDFIGSELLYDLDRQKLLVNGVELVEEAPMDGLTYARANAKWVKVAGGGGGGTGGSGDGSQGPPGPPGPQGPKGDAGATGPKGDTGATGAQGPKGDTGAQGIQGPAGADGTDGAQGPKGDTGAQGPEGAQGAKGDTGATGLPGMDGVSMVTGSGDPTAPGNEIGDSYLDSATGAIWTWNGSTWTNTGTSLEGPMGPQGPKGDTGATGAQGPKGDTGAQGATGPQGPGLPLPPNDNKTYAMKNGVWIQIVIPQTFDAIGA